jgi:hypothetical protein
MHFVVKKVALNHLFWILLAFPLAGESATLKVACGQKAAFPTITSALNALAGVSQGPNTVLVSGACHENVLIKGFNRLTLIAKPGASINDASGGTGLVVHIDDSTGVELRGFTIDGGVIGVMCENFSVCRFDGNTIQGASSIGFQGVQSRATFTADTIQNNGIGLVALESSAVRAGGIVIQNNQGSGVDLDTGGTLAAFGSTIRNNGGNGIEANNNNALLLVSSAVTQNTANGVYLAGHSSADFEADNIVTGNGGSGVWVRDLSFAEFRIPSTVTGNAGGFDVACTPQFSATRGALINIGGGATNCAEPLFAW